LFPLIVACSCFLAKWPKFHVIASTAQLHMPADGKIIDDIAWQLQAAHAIYHDQLVVS